MMINTTAPNMNPPINSGNRFNQYAIPITTTPTSTNRAMVEIVRLIVLRAFLRFAKDIPLTHILRSHNPTAKPHNGYRSIFLYYLILRKYSIPYANMQLVYAHN